MACLAFILVENFGCNFLNSPSMKTWRCGKAEKCSSLSPLSHFFFSLSLSPSFFFLTFSVIFFSFEILFPTSLSLSSLFLFSLFSLSHFLCRSLSLSFYSKYCFLHHSFSLILPLILIYFSLSLSLSYSLSLFLSLSLWQYISPLKKQRKLIGFQQQQKIPLDLFASCIK